MNEIIIKGLDETPSVSLSQAIVDQCAKAITRASTIKTILFDTDRNDAVAAQRDLKIVMNAIEAGRKAAKAPVIALGRQIDAAVDTAQKQLQAEFSRLSGTIAEYETEQEEARQAELRRQQEEARRIENERLAKIRAAEAAQAKAEQEARQKAEQEAAKATTTAAVIAAQEKAEAEMAEAARKAEQVKEAAEAERLAQINKAAAATTAMMAEPKKAEGQIIRKVWVVDSVDCATLVKAFPSLVRMEPNMAEIKKFLNYGTVPPGVKAHQEAQSTVRTGSTRGAVAEIDV